MSDSRSHPLAVAAGKAPPGLSPQDRLSSYNGVPLTAVLGVLAGLAFIFWTIRVYAKTIITRRVGWDDRKLTQLHRKAPQATQVDANTCSVVVCTLGMVSFGGLSDIEIAL